jgi:Uma2 family endonuclease
METMLDALASPRRLSRAEYDHLVELGALADQRVELIRGQIVAMSPQGPPHSSAVRRLNKLLTIALRNHADVQIQAPLAVADDSEPEPDVAVIEPGDYRSEHPTSALLVIEVADSSLVKDRHDKALLYAEAGIPEYWIVNVVEQTVEVYLHPEAGTYRTVVTRSRRDILRPTRLPMIEIALADIF